MKACEGLSFHPKEHDGGGPTKDNRDEKVDHATDGVSIGCKRKRCLCDDAQDSNTESTDSNPRHGGVEIL